MPFDSHQSDDPLVSGFILKISLMCLRVKMLFFLTHFENGDLMMRYQMDA